MKINALEFTIKITIFPTDMMTKLFVTKQWHDEKNGSISSTKTFIEIFPI